MNNVGRDVVQVVGAGQAGLAGATTLTPSAEVRAFRCQLR